MNRIKKVYLTVIAVLVLIECVLAVAILIERPSYAKAEAQASMPAVRMFAHKHDVQLAQAMRHNACHTYPLTGGQDPQDMADAVEGDCAPTAMSTITTGKGNGGNHNDGEKPEKATPTVVEPVEPVVEPVEPVVVPAEPIKVDPVDPVEPKQEKIQRDNGGGNGSDATPGNSSGSNQGNGTQTGDQENQGENGNGNGNGKEKNKG